MTTRLTHSAIAYLGRRRKVQLRKLNRLKGANGKATTVALVNGAALAGAAAVNLDGAAGVLLRGLPFLIAGDPTTYAAAADATLPGAVTLAPALVHSAADDAAVTLQAAHVDYQFTALGGGVMKADDVHGGLVESVDRRLHLSPRGQPAIPEIGDTVVEKSGRASSVRDVDEAAPTDVTERWTLQVGDV
jgi:hypothetical protein